MTSPESATTTMRTGTSAPVSRRIYCLDPLLSADAGTWSAWLDWAAELGFDHVLLPSPFPGSGGDRLSPIDFTRLHPALGWASDLSALTAPMRQRGLVPLLDVCVDRIGGSNGAGSELFAGLDGGAALDPRGEIDADTAMRARVADDAEAMRLGAWWGEQVRGWQAAGLAGVRLLGLSGLPQHRLGAFGASLRRTCPDAVLLGWTPGVQRDALPALAQAGLDGVFSSLPWWNRTSSWFWDEQDRLRRIAPVLHAVEAPFHRRLAQPGGSAAELRRAISVAALSGSGWMMVAGTENADTHPLSRYGSPARSAPAGQAGRSPIDLSADIADTNRLLRTLPTAATVRVLCRDEVLAVARSSSPDLRRATAAELLFVNLDTRRERRVRAETVLPLLEGEFDAFRSASADATDQLRPGAIIDLGAGEVRLYSASAATRSAMPAPLSAVDAEAAAHAPRIGIEAVSPSVDGGLFPAKRIAGELVTVEADIICDGHDMLGVALLWRGPDDTDWHQVRMRQLGNDRWQASFGLTRLGTYRYTVEAWRDAFATYRHELSAKWNASVPIALEVIEGTDLVRDAASRGQVAELEAVAAELDAADEDGKRELLLSPRVAELMAAADDRPFGVRVEPALAIEAERTAARYASWYEVFPRSLSDDPQRHGTFDDVIRHLPRVREMGFDTLYFPPIHPIGRSNRKGKNNSLTAGETDPGSPYAIGSEAGGHTALHPELGDFAAFERLREAASRHGLELAIDFAVQCSPDHPWLKDHPDWFAHRPDGSIRYAENPPKKYEDIVNVDFYAGGAVPSLWLALCDAVIFWAERGVRLFRVDNPHTKPLPFWQWLIGEVRARYPDSTFLAEAFTRPKVMYRLAKIGFSQSYTYFTWRNTAQELREYLTELSTTAPRDFFRPHFFVNTPDINPLFLHDSGRPGFLIRAALAATLSGLWGVYNGFELCEGRPVKPGKEEYLDSEKYELKAWDWDRPGNIVAEITRLNALRRMNPALQTHLGVTFIPTDNDAVLIYEKATEDRSNVVVVAVSLDPRRSQSAGFDPVAGGGGRIGDAALRAEDLLEGGVFAWQAGSRRVELTPDQPYALWRVSPTL